MGGKAPLWHHLHTFWLIGCKVQGGECYVTSVATKTERRSGDLRTPKGRLDKPAGNERCRLGVHVHSTQPHLHLNSSSCHYSQEHNSSELSFHTGRPFKNGPEQFHSTRNWTDLKPLWGSLSLSFFKLFIGQVRLYPKGLVTQLDSHKQWSTQVLIKMLYQNSWLL